MAMGVVYPIGAPRSKVRRDNADGDNMHWKENGMKRSYVALALGLTTLVLLPIAARESLAARIVHTDPSKYRPSPAVHGGAGS
jgi:hypothetical protein